MTNHGSRPWRVAEGVETHAQRDALAALGVHQLQGWLYAAALPQDEFLALIANPLDV